MVAFILRGPFTGDPTIADIIGRCEADGPHVPDIPTAARDGCLSSNLQTVQPLRYMKILRPCPLKGTSDFSLALVKPY